MFTTTTDDTKKQPVRPSLKNKTVLMLWVLALVSGCATSTGPSVRPDEIADRQMLLDAKASEFKQKQVARVRAIAERIVQYMPAEDRAKLKDYHYVVSDDQTINASVASNKMLTVNYGMLRFTESDDELAVVIAHELAHAAKGHLGKSVATGVLATALGLAAGVAVEGVTQGAGMGDKVASGVSRGVSGAFSRDYEREADYFGFQYAYMAGFDLISGVKIWERFAIEAPKTMTVGLFSTHPSSPERLIRAEKTVLALQESGFTPALFNRPGHGSGNIQAVLGKTMNAAGQVIAVPAAAGSLAGSPLGFISSQGSDATADKDTGDGEALTEAQKEIAVLQAEVDRLKKARADALRATHEELLQQAQQEEEFERVLLEAREAAKELRDAEFGVQDMGIAKKVTNLLVAKSVTGEQRVFPLNQASIDWFVQYNYSSANSFKALALNHRKYRAYWYAPNGKLFSEQDFLQSKVRAEFAKTTLTWERSFGKFLEGVWLLRVFENGKLLDERTFEIVDA